MDRESFDSAATSSMLPRSYKVIPDYRKEDTRIANMEEEPDWQHGSLILEEEVRWRKRDAPGWFLPLLSLLLVLSLGLYTMNSMLQTMKQSACRGENTISQTKVTFMPPSVPIDTQSSRLLKCGNSSEEARANGCLFQIWASAWVPEPCYSQAMDEDWRLLQAGSPPSFAHGFMSEWSGHNTGWSYFVDPHGTEILPFEDVISGDWDVLYTTWLQHLWHCIFNWRKVVEGIRGEGVGLTQHDLSLGHVGHCSDMLVNASMWDLDVVNDRIRPGFLVCYV